MVKFKHLAEVKNGELLLENTSRFLEDVKRHDGKKVQVSLSKISSQRSIEQNKYYWGVVNKIISDFTGYTPDETHHILLCSAFGSHEIKQGDTLYQIPNKKSSDLSTGEMEVFLTKSRELGSIEFGLYIPLPNEIEN